MKTSILDQIKAFLAKHAGILIVLLILLFAGWVWIREAKIARITARNTTLSIANMQLQTEREALEKDFKDLQDRYKLISLKNDSLKGILALYQKQLSDMVKKHRHEIDSLLNVPNDTVFVRLQPIYPNFDNTPLKYPFSGSQIRQIYSTAISYPMLQGEFSLQGKALKSCTDLNTGYEAGIANLNKQIANLQANINKCDSQVGNYKEKEVILTKQVSRGKFWTKVFEITTAIATGVAILK